MCGRFTQRAPAERIKREFQLREVPPVEARFNITPTQDVLAVRQTAGDREAVWLKWGLIPSWAKDASMGARLINARGETLTEKPAFREAYKRRRAIIPADGFYEWGAPAGGRKQPYYFRMKDGRVFGFAGLWDRWQDEEGKVVESCAIITTEANALLRSVHDRMPVILHPEEYDLWLGEDARRADDLKEFLRPYPASEMVSYPVSTAVNSPRHQSAELIEPLTANSV
jgi:putative SOS response-associated peptidase YedK